MAGLPHRARKAFSIISDPTPLLPPSLPPHDKMDSTRKEIVRGGRAQMKVKGKSALPKLPMGAFTSHALLHASCG